MSESILTSKRAPFFRQICHFVLSRKKYANEYIPLPLNIRICTPKPEKLFLLLWDGIKSSKVVEIPGFTCPGTLNPNKYKIMNGLTKNSLIVLFGAQTHVTTQFPQYVVHEVIENLILKELE